MVRNIFTSLSDYAGVLELELKDKTRYYITEINGMIKIKI